MDDLNYALFALLGALSGSMLWAYYLPLWVKKTDVTADSPDGNPGVYNCVAKAGWPVGLAALALELLKGALPVFWSTRVLDVDCWAFALVLAAPVAGHAFSRLRGRGGGGKGIAASFGSLLGLMPHWQPVGLLAASYLFFSLIVRVDPHRKRSIVTFVCFAMGAVVWFWATPVALGCVLISTVVVSRHLAPMPEEERTSVCFPLRKK